MLCAIDLRVEYRVDPINVFTSKPRFSWKILTDKTNLLQSAYSIEVAEDPIFSSILWKSGQVNSCESHLIAYEGTYLSSISRYFWRVKIWDNCCPLDSLDNGGSLGEESPLSETAFFETTMLSSDEWQAVFISAEDRNAGKSSAAFLLRKEFTGSGKIKRARLFSSAKGIYIAYVNGKKAGDEVLSPGWTEYEHRLLFQTYDVTSLIKNGSNALGFMVGPGW
jgi:alpha-L-rhamnosidase